MAGVLLSVEDSLDDQLRAPDSAAVRRRSVDALARYAAAPPADQDLEFKLVSEAVLRECIVNMARIKEAVSIAVQKPGDFARRRASTMCRSCCAALPPAC